MDHAKGLGDEMDDELDQLEDLRPGEDWNNQEELRMFLLQHCPRADHTRSILDRKIFFILFYFDLIISMKLPRRVPWTSVAELDYVCALIFTEESTRESKQLAVQRVLFSQFLPISSLFSRFLLGKISHPYPMQ